MVLPDGTSWGAKGSVHGQCTAIRIWEPFRWKAPWSFSKSGTQIHVHMYLNSHLFWKVQCRRTPILKSLENLFRRLNSEENRSRCFPFNYSPHTAVHKYMITCTSTFTFDFNFKKLKVVSLKNTKIFFKSQMFQYLTPCTTTKIIFDFELSKSSESRAGKIQTFFPKLEVRVHNYMYY